VATGQLYAQQPAPPGPGAPEAQAPARPMPPPRRFPLWELAHETHQLSYIDTDSCMTILGYLGYNTSPPTGDLAPENLPAVFPLPVKGSAGVVGGSSVDEEKAPDKVGLREETLSAPHNRLMILYHDGQREQVSRLKELLVETIDVPERQVLIEGMVVELTEEDFKELGVQWNRSGGQVTFIPEGERVPFLLSFDAAVNPSDELTNRIRTLIRAVIQEGQAEILSSPSVLVLNNRNARIKIVRDTPILSTKVTFDIQNVDVRFEPVGIVLNIKPRISHDDSTVTMQIIAEVSEIPQGEEIEIAGTVVAPAIDRRIVETVARVHNNTPFIIGGLIRNEKVRTVDRVPVLSRIPLLGVLFRRDVTRREKREVIIVLTPRVIPIKGSHRPVLPKDSARFDFLNNRLFRNSYRLKAEDVFDLGFVQNNETIRQAFQSARQLVNKHAQYADRQPFRELADGTIPGEDAVVVRMIYEIVKDKLALHERVRPENLIFFERDDSKPAGFGVGWLVSEEGGGILQQASPDGTLPGYFGRPYPKEVPFLRFGLDPEGGLDAALLSRAADLEWHTVQDRDEVERLLLDCAHLGVDHRFDEFAVALDTPKDLVRLRTAVALREVAKVNNFEDLMALRDFHVGRKFVIPELGSQRERMFLIDHAVAGFFFKSDYYYEALKDRLESSYRVLEEALAREGM
jgi:Flp pilus assembly secretin CpaC